MTLRYEATESFTRSPNIMPQFELIGSSIARICYLQKLLHNLPPFGNTSADIDNEDCFDLDCHLMELSTQQALLHNAIVLILAEVIDEDDLMELLKHPTGHDWKSPLIENKARVVLGQNYEKFFDRMSQLHVHLNVICEVFNVHTQVSVDVRQRPNQPKFMKVFLIETF